MKINYTSVDPKYYEGRLREDTAVSMHRAFEIRIEIIIIFITYELQRL